MIRLATGLMLFSLSWTATMPVGPARSEEAGFNPLHHVRAVLSSQEALANGADGAHEAHLRALTAASEAFAKADRNAWDAPAARRALLVLGLIGGEIRAIKRLITTIQVPADDQRFMTAYLEMTGRNEAKSIETVLDARARLSDPLLSTAIALHVAPLVASSQPALALSLLEEVRLEAPGTLFEETALRRQTILALRRNNVSAAVGLTRRYLKRFPNSAFANGHLEQVSGELVNALREVDDEAVASAIESLNLSTRAARIREALCRDLLLAGRAKVASLLLRKTEAIEAPKSPGMRLCLAAVRILEPGGAASLLVVAKEFTEPMPNRDRVLIENASTAARAIIDASLLMPGSDRNPEDKRAIPTQEDVATLVQRARDGLTRAEKTYRGALR